MLAFYKISGMVARMFMMITPFYAGLLALCYLALSLNIVVARYRFRAAMGDHQQFALTRRVRAHANFIEYTPLFLILLAFAEMQRSSVYTIHALGIAFLIGRLAHGYSMLHHERYVDGKIQAYPYWRTMGMVCTFSPIAIVAVIVLINFIQFPR